jgi:hypothetical protein
VEVQPTPKLGDWFEVLTESREAKLPKREHRSTQRLFEELRGRGAEIPIVRDFNQTRVDERPALVVRHDQNAAHDA